MPAKKIEGKRALLNLPGYQSTAAIVAEVVTDEYGAEASVQISDCTRKISLEFYAGRQEDHENNLHKVDTMLDALRVFRRALVKAQKASLR